MIRKSRLRLGRSSWHTWGSEGCHKSLRVASQVFDMQETQQGKNEEHNQTAVDDEKGNTWAKGFHRMDHSI